VHVDFAFLYFSQQSVARREQLWFGASTPDLRLKWDFIASDACKRTRRRINTPIASSAAGGVKHKNKLSFIFQY
jgi:hypothetical protein